MRYNRGMERIHISHHDRTMDARLCLPAKKNFPVVVISHGFGGSCEDFAPLAEFLQKKGAGALSFTFCGSGKQDLSGFPTTQMTLLSERDDLLAAADYAREIEGCTKIFLFGASQGGMVSALAAQLCPDKFAGLALLYPAFCIPDDWNARYPDNVPEKTILWDVALGREFFLTLRGMDVYREMPAFRKKVVLMHGTEDDIVPIRYSERAAECYPFARLIPFPGEGHGFSPPAMERVARETLALLNL